MKLFLISLIPYLIFSIYKTKKSFHMLQQNYYDLDLRYFRWIFSNIRKITFENDILFVLLGLLLFFNSAIAIGVFIILYGIIFINYNKKKVIAKKPLVITARIKRLSFTMFLIYFITVISIINNFNFDYIVYYYVYLGLITYLNYFVVMFANIINIPVEKCVYLYYKV